MRLKTILRPLLKPAYRLYAIRAQLGHGAGLGVRIMLIQNDQVMLVKHTYQDHWYFPGGGLKHRETPLQAAIREANEEVGVIVDDEPWLLGIYSNFREKKNDHCLVFVSTHFRVEKASDRWEIEQVGFYPIHALPADVSPGTGRRVEEYLAGERGLAEMW